MWELISIVPFYSKKDNLLRVANNIVKGVGLGFLTLKPSVFTMPHLIGEPLGDTIGVQNLVTVLSWTDLR